MDEPTETQKVRKARSDKGKPRGVRKVAPQPVSSPPVEVLIVLKNGRSTEFGCAEHFVENGFHVFTYPSERDRYRTTRREFAISEIVEVEITEAAHYKQTEAPTLRFTPANVTYTGTPAEPAVSTGPKIHSVRKNAASIINSLEHSTGPIKMDNMPSLTFGNEAPRGLESGGE
jgi:hypothetical protein